MSNNIDIIPQRIGLYDKLTRTQSDVWEVLQNLYDSHKNKGLLTNDGAMLISNKELSSYVGCSPRWTSQTLKTLRALGYIKLEYYGKGNGERRVWINGN